MPHIPILTAEAAPTEVADVYSEFQQKMAFPAAPNFIKVQGHSLSVTRGTWALVQNVLVKGTLPRSLKEMMFVAISEDRDCRYCLAAHIACCRMLGVDAVTIEQLVSSIDELTPLKMREILKFGIKCSRDPRSLDWQDFANLQSHGLTHAEIVEVIGMSALAVYANIMADATGIEPDGMFSAL